MKTFFLTLISLFACLIARADDAKPWTFWYWMNGAVTKEGITTDLQAMADIGLGGCYLMPVYGIDQAPELGGTLRQGTPEWWQMVDFALHEADRHGLKIGMHICDGFALAGGPWISPAQSMQRVVSSDTILCVNRREGLPFTPEMLPSAPKGYYEDIATYAVPFQYQPATPATLQPKIASVNPDFTIDKRGRIKCTSACTFTYTYDEPITVNALQITTYNNSLQALRMRVSCVPEDTFDTKGKQSQQSIQLIPPRHGWQNYDQPTTVSLPTVRTRQLIFEWSPEGTEKGAEDLDNAKWGKSLKIEQMQVLSEPRIDDWEGKAGRVWRVSSEEQDATSPEMYIPLDKVIRLTSGTLLPQGKWRIIRMGHSSTLHENSSGGDARGLECDKFSRSAILSQLSHWYEQAFSQCDPKVAQRVLRYMHVDSWECGNQNWSDSIWVMRNEAPSLLARSGGKQLGMKNEGEIVNFAQYFELRRGYDLMPYLPLMVGIPMVDRETSERVLRDVRTTIGDLANEVFYATVAERAHQLGCQLSAESIAPVMISDGMTHYRHTDFPMGEFWLNSPTHDKPNDMLDAISAGHLYGKQIIQAEGFTELRGSFERTPAQLKPLLDKQFCFGMNRLFFHVFTHNPEPSKKPGMTLNGVGLFFQPTQPWWPEGKSLVDYITRCQRLLQMGRPVVDIAVYTGHEMPRRAILPDQLQPLYGYHYDSFNYDGLINGVLNGKTQSLFRPDYKVLLIPGARKLDPGHQPLPEDARLVIERLKAEGKMIIEGQLTNSQLDDMHLLPDALLPAEVHFAHRCTSNNDIYFIANQQNKARHISALLRDHHNRPAYLYWPIDHTYQEIHYNQNNDQQAMVEIDLPAHGSCFVLFGSAHGLLKADTEEEATTALVPTQPYRLHFEANGKTLTSDTLPDWSQSDNDSIRYYSGRVRYSVDFRFKPLLKATRHHPIGINGKTVQIPIGHKIGGRVILRFNDLHDAATILLNGHPCGSVWTAPYEIDVTDAIREGKNHLEVWVANSWHNAIMGHDAGRDPFPLIWTNAQNRDTTPHLLPAGLGPIEIICRK